jgi:hypothetical protein
MATMGAFVTMAPANPGIAAACLGANTLLSFLKGYTTTAAIGGADMRTFSQPSSTLLSLIACSGRDHRLERVLRVRPSR